MATAKPRNAAESVVSTSGHTASDLKRRQTRFRAILVVLFLACTILVSLAIYQYHLGRERYMQNPREDEIDAIDKPMQSTKRIEHPFSAGGAVEDEQPTFEVPVKVAFEEWNAVHFVKASQNTSVLTYDGKTASPPFVDHCRIQSKLKSGTTFTNIPLNVVGRESFDSNTKLLSRFARFGVDFLDDYNMIKFNISSASGLFDLSLGYGHDSFQINSACLVQDKRIVLYRVNSFGFGSDCVNRVNYMLWASHLGLMHPPLVVAWVRTNKTTEASHPWYALLTFLESTFLFRERTFGCDYVVPEATPPMWTSLQSDNKELRAYVLSNFTKEAPFIEAVVGLKSLLLRQTLRMPASARRELDYRHNQALSHVRCSTKKETRQITMHIRRGDKKTETAFLPLCRYLEALFRIIKQEIFGLPPVHRTAPESIKMVKFQRAELEKDLIYDTQGCQPENPREDDFVSSDVNHVILHIVTDDGNVTNEFLDLIVKRRAELRHVDIQVNSRITLNRPDKPKKILAADVYETSWRLLVDLRLMASADWFIGSQSSYV